MITCVTYCLDAYNIFSSGSNSTTELNPGKAAPEYVASTGAGGWQKPKAPSGSSSSDSNRDVTAGPGGWKPGTRFDSFDDIIYHISTTKVQQ